MAILGAFLDAMQKVLVEIPVDELKKEDSNDLNFIEEGRRCLVITQFQVYGDGSSRDGGDNVVNAVIENEEDSSGSVVAGNDNNDDQGEKLTSAVWTEIACLVQDNEADTGLLIILPNALKNVYKDMGGLKEFTKRKQYIK